MEIPIKDLPLYNRDFDADYPPSGKALKEAIASVDAVLFVTPEYNSDIRGSLKNAIDWASRPWGTNSFAHKPSAVLGASPGKIGTAVAQQNLRSVLSYCDSPQMGAPEAYIQLTPGLITGDGQVTEESTEKFLKRFHGSVRSLHRPGAHRPPTRQLTFARRACCPNHVRRRPLPSSGPRNNG